VDDDVLALGGGVVLPGGPGRRRGAAAREERDDPADDAPDDAADRPERHPDQGAELGSGRRAERLPGEHRDADPVDGPRRRAVVAAGRVRAAPLVQLVHALPDALARPERALELAPVRHLELAVACVEDRGPLRVPAEALRLRDAAPQLSGPVGLMGLAELRGRAVRGQERPLQAVHPPGEVEVVVEPAQEPVARGGIGDGELAEHPGDRRAVGAERLGLGQAAEPGAGAPDRLEVQVLDAFPGLERLRREHQRR
jgi:hypothetical protein